MANIVTRRLFNRNLFKFKDLTHLTTHARCTSVCLVNIPNTNHGLFPKSDLHLKYHTNDRIQCYKFYSKGCEDDSNKKLSIFQRFKQMYKNYWYVLVPVHLVTSAAWFGGFYYLAKSGVDIVALLNALHVSEKFSNSLKDSSMGYLALAYALYKVSTPARYAVTLGGTTISINYLKKWGYIKPVPSIERLNKMYHEQKDNLLETVRETREGLKVQSEKLKDKGENIIEDLKQLKELGDEKTKRQVVEKTKQTDIKSKRKV